MSAPGLFRAVRRFYMDGEPVEIGTRIEIADNELIADLMAGQRIEPADVPTTKRLQSEPTLTFKEVEGGGVGRRGIVREDNDEKSNRVRRVFRLALVSNRK